MSHCIRITRGFGLCLTVAALGLTGCYARAHADFAEADYTPVHLDAYPHTVYEGRVVYLVNDRWYTRDQGRWVYYRVEPTPLYRQRVVVHQAPRAPARHAPPHVARGRHIERDDRHHDRRHDRHDPERVRERHDVHQAPPAMHRD
jgi:hypothetical protein